MMQLQDHNHLWRDMWLRIMCLKLKHSGHWNLLQVTIHLTRPRTLLNFFQQCSLTVKLLGICLWRAKSSILLCIWSGWTLQKAAPRQCQWTFCCIVWWKPKHKNAGKANGCPCEVLESSNQQGHKKIFQQWISWWVLSLLLWTSYSIVSSFTFCADV